MPVTDPATTAPFARRALLDAGGRLAGYQLLHPDGRVTPRLAPLVLTETGLHAAAGGAPAYLRVTPSFLEALDPLPFGPEGVVLELGSGTALAGPLGARLARLREHGYALAVDRYTGEDDDDPLLALAGVARVDAGTTDHDLLPALAARLHDAGVRALAAGVDDHEAHDRCRAAGFELFQGDFLARPRTVGGHTPAVSQLGHLRLAAAVADPDAGMDELEAAITLDGGLTLRLLRFLGSAAFGLRHEIASVRRAIVLLGAPTIRQWALLLLLGGLADGRTPLLTLTLARARTCQAIAERLGAPDAGAYFFAGILSTADALLDVPMTDALEQLPIADDVRAALLDGAGGKGRALAMTRACEAGDWERAALPALDAGALAALHADALAWADEATRGLAG